MDDARADNLGVVVFLPTHGERVGERRASFERRRDEEPVDAGLLGEVLIDPQLGVLVRHGDAQLSRRGLLGVGRVDEIRQNQCTNDESNGPRHGNTPQKSKSFTGMV